MKARIYVEISSSINNVQRFQLIIYVLFVHITINSKTLRSQLLDNALVLLMSFCTIFSVSDIFSTLSEFFDSLSFWTKNWVPFFSLNCYTDTNVFNWTIWKKNTIYRWSTVVMVINRISMKYCNIKIFRRFWHLFYIYSFDSKYMD